MQGFLFWNQIGYFLWNDLQTAVKKLDIKQYLYIILQMECWMSFVFNLLARKGFVSEFCTKLSRCYWMLVNPIFNRCRFL